MAKLTALVLLLAVAVAASTASAYTTVVTTTVTEESNPRGSSCEMEMREKMPMTMCMMWMQRQMRSPYSRRAVANPRYQEEHLNECCSELKSFSSGCRCEALKMMPMSMQPYGQMEEMQRMACSLPSKCGISDCHCGASPY